MIERRGFSVAIFKGLKCEFKKLRVINTQVQVRTITQGASESIGGKENGGKWNELASPCKFLKRKAVGLSGGKDGTGRRRWRARRLPGFSRGCWDGSVAAEASEGHTTQRRQLMSLI